MLFPLIVVAFSLALGAATGGSIRALERLRLHWWALAPIGLAMQLAPIPSVASTSGALATAILVSSFPVLLAFVGRNLRVAGFALIFLGLSLNFAVIAANGGMPVSREAIERAGEGGGLEELVSSGGAKHHLMGPDDVLRPLGDVIAIGDPLREAFSAGDLAVYLGLAWMVVAAMRGRTPETDRWKPRPRGYRGKHRRHRRPPPGTPEALRPAEAATWGTSP
jgi:Family of unknown function (DUF5317)